jgi:hypothetical protein
MIDKDKLDYEKKIQKAKQQTKYLAKEITKESNPKGSWCVKGNRIPKQ